MIPGILLAGPAGFGELMRAVTEISDSVLSERLAELGEAGLNLRSGDEGHAVAIS